MSTVPDLRAEVLSALSTAGAYCGECGFEPGETGCPDCVKVRGWYADAVMPIIERLRAELAQARTAPALRLDPADLRELALILTEERYRLDKGDDRPVPQPRWGANVRISQAANAALDAVARQAADTTSNAEPADWQDIKCPGCRAAARRADGLDGGAR